MFLSDEDIIKQRLHDLQEEYLSYKMERLFRKPKRGTFWKKLLKRFASGYEKVVVKQENNQPSFHKK
jgi:hypothetical protein